MRLALATAFVLIVLAAPAKGQSVDALSLQSGARARILGPTTDAKYEPITVASVSPDSLRYSLDPSIARGSVSIYQDCNQAGYCTDIQFRNDTTLKTLKTLNYGATKSLAWQQISKMDASMGRQRHTWRGAGIGFLVGLVGGAAVGATASGCCGKEGRQLRAVAIVANGLLGGAIGGLVGGVIGSRQRTEDWMPVTLPRTPVASNRVNGLGRPAVPVAKSGSCVPDTTERAKLYRDGYGSMVSRTDSQSVAQRTSFGLPTLQASAVTIVTDSAACSTASAAYDTALGVSAASEAPIVLKLGNQWIVIKKLDFPGVSPNVLFNLDFNVAQQTIWF